ncbi:MAG: sigma-70 family RNA polymerase sigma factor [Planctomycetaceae bacterium]|nr:sigma-70 family RNA polymerase sigma factor [Planctomycetaceae bacterium]
MAGNNSQFSSEFLQLLMSNQMRIYAFILSLVRNYEDADDIMQDTANTMWQKYPDSQPINDFAAWSMKIAYYKILDHRKRQKTDSRIQFNSELFEKIVPIAQEIHSRQDSRTDRLKRCLQRLSEREFKLVDLRYYQNIKPKEISSLLDMSILNVYKSMARVHGHLLECMQRS